MIDVSVIRRAAPLRSLLVLAILGVSLGTSAESAELIWTGDFETGDFSQYKSKMSREGKRTKRKIVSSPVRDGKYASELVVLGKSDNGGSERAELLSQLKNDGGKIRFKWDGPEYWIGFSFLFKEWDANAYTFFQVHAPNEAKGDPCDMAGNAFSIWGDGADKNGGVSRDIVVRVIEDGGKSRGKGAASNNKVVHRYPFPIDKWQDYVVNFKLSTRGKGFFKIWKNGKQVYSKSGLTNVNHIDSCGKKIPSNLRRHDGVHIGIYSPGSAGYRRIFYDEVRVATGADGYDLVSPGAKPGSSSETPGSDSPVPESVPKPPVVIIADD